MEYPVPGILQARTLEWVAISFEPPGKSNCYKTSHQNLLGWDTPHFERQGLIAWQSNKALLFHFTQNSVSEIWFGTSAQRSSVLASHSYLQSLVILLVDRTVLTGISCLRGYKKYISKFSQYLPLWSSHIHLFHGPKWPPQVSMPGYLLAGSSDVLIMKLCVLRFYICLFGIH